MTLSALAARAVRAIHRLEDASLVLLVGAMLLLACGQILLRNAFSVTLLWADPLIRHLVLWTGMLGAMVATREDKHIHIDALLRAVPSPWSDGLKALSLFFSAAVCVVLTRVSLRFIADERAYGMEGFLDIPSWILQLIFPLTFGAMALRFAFRGGRQCLALFVRRPA